VKFGGNKANGYGNRMLSGNEWEPQSNKANRRTVWRMATAQYPGSHFAVMPAEMAELCILSGCPPYVCAECGEPWIRVVEKSTPYKTGGGNTQSSAIGPMDRNGKGQWDSGAIITTRATISKGFIPACQCSAPTRPGVVLDPFIGSGTVAEMAIKHNRSWLGFDLNPEYVELANERINGTQPLLAGII